MVQYKSLDRDGRLAYVNENVPRETVINYQNAIGKSLCPLFNIRGKTTSVSGFAGKHRINTDLIIQRRPDGTNTLSIIREDGTHISSFSQDRFDLEKLVKNGFWVLRDRNL
jgi:hypothetical protein